jgi:hypothetical protein
MEKEGEREEGEGIMVKRVRGREGGTEGRERGEEEEEKRRKGRGGWEKGG